MSTDTQDMELAANVLAGLVCDPLVPDARIRVSVRDGVVSLTGAVDGYDDKIAILRAAQRISGAKALALEIQVTRAEPVQPSDPHIAVAIERALLANSAVPHHRVTAVVDHGQVILSGELDWNFQRRAVAQAVRRVAGVQGINDHIRLSTQTAPLNLAMRIQEALTRQAMREARRIDIRVRSGTVTLRGQVHSGAERQAAEGAAWSAPGISAVDNQLRIEE